MKAEFLAQNVVHGKSVFTLWDTYGIPFDVIQDELRKQELAFDVLTFVKAAQKSGNFLIAKQLYNVLTFGITNQEVIRQIQCIFRHVYDI